MKKILVFIGTRPEAIKLAPVVKELHRSADFFNTKLIATGQHKEMLQQTLSDFSLQPDILLDVMSPNQTLAALSSRLFDKIGTLIDVEKPNMIIAQGDTTTVMVAAVCAFYHKIPCAHVEAGLRTGNIHSPFPEEFNRKVASLATTLHFAPTATAAKNLRAEGVPAHTITVCGNTVIDALLWKAEQLCKKSPKITTPINKLIKSKKPYVLITGHRRENFGIGLKNICTAITKLAKKNPDLSFIYPVHLNPKVKETVHTLLSGLPNIYLTSPLAYSQFVYLMQNSWCILTDSGGIQEEAPSLGKPVLIMRDSTERPEGIEAGCAKLIGTNTKDIFTNVMELRNNTSLYNFMATVKSPYGDGNAAKIIVEKIKEFFI